MDVHESNPRGENEEKNRRSLVNPKSFARWLELWSWHTFDGDEGMVEAMTLSLSLEMKDGSLEKAMGTLTPKGVFIALPTKLKWLKPTKGLDHLI